MKLKYWFLMLTLAMGCKQKYMAKLNTPINGNLVVEGFINTGDSATNFTLSRTSSLDSGRIIPETAAKVDVQSSNGLSYPLSETSPGNYSIGQVPIDISQQYRLHIKTSNGKEYLSDLADVKTSPPIDSISWAEGTDGIHISVSSHDAQKKSIYYQWEYQETWQYSAPLTTNYIRTSPMTIVARDSNQVFPNFCWSSDVSSDIIISSSEKLSKDVIYEFPLTRVSYATNKLSIRYSMLVKQYVLTKDWYGWQQRLQKNTEEFGSIFDAQPSEVAGNIHCTTDPNELVIGFVGCTSASEKRIFINRSDIQELNISTGYELCDERPLKWYDSKSDSALGGSGTVITGLGVTAGKITTVFVSSTECVDCVLHGGTETKPDFWYRNSANDRTYN